MVKRRKMTFEERQQLAEKINEILASDSDFGLDSLGPSVERRKSLKTPGERLTNYHIFVGDSVFWGSRQEFLKLIQSFLWKEIDGETFSSQFFRLRGQSMLDTEDLCVIIEDRITPIPDLNYTSKAVDFASAMDDLFMEIDRYNPDVDGWDCNQIVYSESQLRFIIKQIFVPILEKSCDLDPAFFEPKIDVDRLIERNYKILFSVGLLVTGFLLFNFN